MRANVMTGREFARVCRALLQEPLPDPTEEGTWFLEAKRGVLDELDSVTPELSGAFLHFIHHWVSDADIRREDQDYRRSQDAAFLGYIEDYETMLRGDQ